MPLPDASSEDSGLASAVKSRTAHVVHLTHNDLDAVGADAVHRMKFGNDGVFTIWSSVGKFPALFSLVASCEGKGDLLSISDLGYHQDAESIAVKARKNGWTVEWRDHHRWREEEVKKMEKAVSLLRIDTSVCGTGIVARDLLPGGSGCHGSCTGCLRLRSLETCRSPFRGTRAGAPAEGEPGPCPGLPCPWHIHR